MNSVAYFLIVCDLQSKVLQSSQRRKQKNVADENPQGMTTYR